MKINKPKVKEMMKRIDEMNNEKKAIGIPLLDIAEENKICTKG